MLLAQRDNAIFNSVLAADGIHNSFLEVVKAYKNERAALMERLTPEQFEGDMGSGVLSREEALALQPRMIGVNSLVEDMRRYAASGNTKSGKVLDRLHHLLRERLGLPYKIEST